MTMSYLCYEKNDVIAHYNSNDIICIDRGTLYPNVNITVEQFEDVLKVPKEDNYHYEWRGELPWMLIGGETEITVSKIGNEIIISNIWFPYNKTMFPKDGNTSSFKSTFEECQEILHACKTNFEVRI